MADVELDEFAAQVVVSGVPRPLSYSFSSEEFLVDIGSEVLIEVGNRQAKGWVVEKLPLRQAIGGLDTELPSQQLSLLATDDPLSKARRLKPIRSSAPAFLPEQLAVFRWMADYYGTSLVDVIENAVPRRHIAKRRSPAKAPENKLGTVKALAPDLTTAQAQAVTAVSAALDSKTFQPLLLFGVTGSGKTEVYLRAIQKVLDEGGSALVIVPEIALTPQLFDQFESRLAVPPAVLHSQVGPSLRWANWQAMLDGTTRVAIGARSAIFAPLPNLRLIIVDEEHESSYKQSDGLRYHARDVAMMRAKFSGATIVLGSATPSFESLLNASKKRYQLLQLPDRVSDRPLPTIEVVDLKTIKRRDMPSENLSPQLHAAISETLERRGQVVILYNRRGFSSYLQCETCNEVVLCPNCSVPFTHHKGRNKLLCHYCSQTVSPPTHCVFCRNQRTTRIEGSGDTPTPEEVEAAQTIGRLVPRGAGTERVVEEIAQLFPQARIARLDRDTVGSKDSYRQILGTMRSGEADILVGTQMIAKGHDLPGVTLVGIIDADVGLHAPDFRASEKTYQLITQASGRAGRGDEPGRVIVQTREPKHPTIVATVTGRFRAFARFELDYRKKLHYPPFGKLLRVVISSPDQQDAFQAATLTKRAIDELTSFVKLPDSAEDSFPIAVLGPAVAPHEKLRGRYRWHILVKAPSAAILSSLAGRITSWRTTIKDLRDVRVSVDVDPVDML